MFIVHIRLIIHVNISFVAGQSDVPPLDRLLNRLRQAIGRVHQAKITLSLHSWNPRPDYPLWFTNLHLYVYLMDISYRQWWRQLCQTSTLCLIRLKNQVDSKFQPRRRAIACLNRGNNLSPFPHVQQRYVLPRYIPHDDSVTIANHPGWSSKSCLFITDTRRDISHGNVPCPCKIFKP